VDIVGVGVGVDVVVGVGVGVNVCVGVGVGVNVCVGVGVGVNVCVGVGVGVAVVGVGVGVAVVGVGVGVDVGVGVGEKLLQVFGILKRTKSNELALLLWSELYVFNKSSSKRIVFVIVKLCVILLTQSVVITPSEILLIKGFKSKSNINLVYPEGETESKELPKYISVIGFLPVLTNLSLIIVLFLLKYDLCVDIYYFTNKYHRIS
jgi:hypothetical protein